MISRVIFAVFASLLLFGCVTDRDRERRDFDSAFYWGNHSRLKVSTSPQVLCADADNSALSRRERGECLLALFASYVRPGFTSQQMQSAFPDTRWLEGCSLEKIIGVGGAVDFDWMSGAAFCLRVCPDKTGWSDWGIEFTLTPDQRGVTLNDDDARAFLEGVHTNRELRLAEFVLFYPVEPSVENGKVSLSERFTSKGVGLMVHP